jgi:hypothetical protein
LNVVVRRSKDRRNSSDLDHAAGLWHGYLGCLMSSWNCVDFPPGCVELHMERYQSSKSTYSSKSAPAPISRYTLSYGADNTTRFALFVSEDIHGGSVRPPGARGAFGGCRFGLVQPVGLPESIVLGTVVTGAIYLRQGVKSGMLIEWNVVRRVVGAEDISTSPTMMPSCEKGERFVACWGVAGWG